MQRNEIYEGRIVLYSFIRRIFVPDFDIIRDPNRQYTIPINSTDSAHVQGGFAGHDIGESRSSRGFGGIGRSKGPGCFISARDTHRIGNSEFKNNLGDTVLHSKVSTGIKIHSLGGNRIGWAGDRGCAFNAGGEDEVVIALDPIHFNNSLVGPGTQVFHSAPLAGMKR